MCLDVQQFLFFKIFRHQIKIIIKFVDDALFVNFNFFVIKKPMIFFIGFWFACSNNYLLYEHLFGAPPGSLPKAATVHAMLLPTPTVL